MHAGTTTLNEGDGAGSSAAPQVVQKTELVAVPFKDGFHDVADFQCALSQHVQGFFGNQAKRLITTGYCRVFIWPDPEKLAQILGYYTLSAALLQRNEMSGTDERKAIFKAVPFVRIGFMGRDDRTEKGFGAALLYDAALRAYQNPSIGAWGLVLEPEEGPARPKLWNWYLDLGFKPCRTRQDGALDSLYAPFTALLRPADLS